MEPVTKREVVKIILMVIIGARKAGHLSAYLAVGRGLRNALAHLTVIVTAGAKQGLCRTLI
jgi:hypothetical protein